MGGRTKPDPPHGTRRRYQLRRDPCRCDDCRAAHAAFHRRYRLEQRHRRTATIDGRTVEWSEPPLPIK